MRSTSQLRPPVADIPADSPADSPDDRPADPSRSDRRHDLRAATHSRRPAPALPAGAGRAALTPLSRQMACPVCAPHERHLLPCEVDDCGCRDAPIPGVTTQRRVA
jgi:hypothetical protein